MKILVTGGTGFLGRHVVWRLARAGHEVVFSGRQQAAATQVLQHAPRNTAWLPVDHGSADAAAALTQAAARTDACVHCAALSAPWGTAEQFQHANVRGTQDVLQACTMAAVPRLVHISTPSLYFDFSDRLDIREDSVLPPPVNEYARTKGIAEQLVRAAAIPHKVILRPRAVFGPWDTTLLPRLLRAMEAGPLPLMRGGAALLDVTYVDNAVDAICLALEQPLPRALNVYNVSNGEPLRLAELLAMLSENFGIRLRTRRVPWPLVRALAHCFEARARLRTGHEPPFTRYSAGVLAFSQTLHLGAIRHELGYVPRVPVREGIRRHAEWFRGGAGALT